MKKQIQGFTLIELLVVIAIIGILAAVVLPSLNTARMKGRVVAFQSEIDSFRKAAEIFYSNGNTYTGLFTNSTDAQIATSTVSDPNIQSILSSLANRAPDGAIHGGIAAGGDAYAVYGRLPGSDPASLLAADIWCTNSIGKAGNPTADATTEFTTPVSVCW